jgi:hypothetical protein
MAGEISYDLVMEDDMAFVEGTFRLPYGEWQVVIVSKRPVLTMVVNRTTWDSGVTGIFVEFPKEQVLGKSAVMRLLSETYGIKIWNEVRGPDSMILR